MSKRPDYIAQGDSPRTERELQNWYDMHTRNAKAGGSKRTRMSVLYLFEAWNEDIKDSEMGPPHFTLEGGW